jgi:hypothetical protein
MKIKFVVALCAVFLRQAMGGKRKGIMDVD